MQSDLLALESLISTQFAFSFSSIWALQSWIRNLFYPASLNYWVGIIVALTQKQETLQDKLNSLPLPMSQQLNLGIICLDAEYTKNGADLIPSILYRIKRNFPLSITQ